MKKSMRVLSLVLAMMMLFSAFSILASAKSVDLAETGATIPAGQVLYLKPNSNWTQAGAWFAAYIWDSSSTFVKAEACPRDSGYYKVTIPSGTWKNIIWCRMNSSATTANWDNVWNQTNDLTWDGTKSLYTVGSGAWSKGSGSWSVWSETPEPTEAPTEAETEAPSEDEPIVDPEQPTEEPTQAPTEAPTEPIAKTVYAIDSMKWGKVSAHAWVLENDTVATAWPGLAMTKTEDTVNGFDVYEITFDVDYNSIIFNNNNGGQQTADLTLEEGKYYDIKTGTWYDSLADVPVVDPLSTDRYLVGSFDNWDALANEFKLDAEGSSTGYVSLDLEANTTYEFKVIREGAWTSNATAITGDVSGLTFSSSVSGNAKITTKAAGTYVFSFGMTNSQLAVTYPVDKATLLDIIGEAVTYETSLDEFTDETWNAMQEKLAAARLVYDDENATQADVDAATQALREAIDALERVVPTPPPTEPEATPDEPTDAPVVIPAGYYLVGTLNGAECWFVDENSADRMLTANPGNEGEYMLHYTFTEGDEVKVAYFDGTAITVWYQDGSDNNYNIGAEKAGAGTIYFRPEGNDTWSYYFFTVLPDVVEEPTQEETQPEATEPEATGDEPATEPEATEPEVEPTEPEATEYITIYFQNNWLWENVCCYTWDANGDYVAAWPGAPMEFYANDGNYDVYVAKIPVGNSFIINGIKDDGTGTRDETPTITDAVDGRCYYMLWDNGNAVGYADINVIVKPEEPTEEPEFPEVVSGATVGTVTETSIDLTWDAIAGAQKYWVWVNGEVKYATTDTSITIKADSNTTYELAVTAKLADDTIQLYANAEKVEVTTPATVADEFTYEVSASSTINTVTIDWTTNIDTKAWVYLGTSADALKIVGATTANTLTVNNLKTNTTYYYKTRYIVDGVAFESEVTEIKTVEPQVNLNVDVANRSVRVDWSDYENATKYWVITEANGKEIIMSSYVSELTIPYLVFDYEIRALVDGKVITIY